MNKELPKYRNKEDTTGLAIQKVGIRGVRAPFTLKTKNGGDQETIGTWSIYTDLSAQFKGVSMSLMERILHQTLQNEISVDILKDITTQIYEKSEHKSKDVYVKVKFPYSIKVKAPASGFEAVKVYDCMLEVRNIDGKIKKYLTVKVQYIATCPCAAELADELMKTENKQSMAHQQRGFAEITIEFGNEIVWIEDVINIAENELKATPYPVIRRPDEQNICYTARQNCAFVEEAVRNICLGLIKESRILDYVVVCNHEESIHSHSAVAVMNDGKELK